MKLSKCLQLLAAIVVIILLPTSNAGRKKIVFKKVYSSASPLYPNSQPVISRPPSPTNLNPGPSGTTGEKLVTPKESFPHLPGTSGTHKSVELRKHSDFPVLDGNHPRTVDHNARLSPSLQRKSSLSPQAESVLSNNPFARLPGAQTSNKHVNQPKQPEEFPTLFCGTDRLNGIRNRALTGSSNHDRSFRKNSLESPEAQRKSSLQEFPALPGSSHAKNPNNRPSLESLTNSQSKLSLDQLLASPSSNNRLHILKNSPTGLDPSANSQPKKSLEEFLTLPGSNHAKNPNSRPSLESLTNSQSKLSLDQLLASPSSNNRLHIPKNSPTGLDPSANPQPKKSLEEFLTLPGSNHAKNPNSRPSLKSLTNSQSKLSLDQFPALPSSNNRLHILKNSPTGLDSSANPPKKISFEEYPALGVPKGLLRSTAYPVERSSSLTLNTQSSASPPAFVRGGSIESTNNFRFPSQFNSPLNSPLQKNKSFFGSSSSSLTSTSGFGMSYQSTSRGSFSSLSTGLNSPGIGRGKKLSDLAQVPQTLVDVSDQTCKDDTSPAEQCFNYFTFSLFWPPALGYEYKVNSKPTNNNVNVARWSIHGLWPSSYNGPTPKNCRKRTSVSFSQYRFEHEKGLRANLESKWINICPYKLHGCSLVSFWNREFTTHGVCASRLPLIGSDVGYFKMAISLANSVNIDNVLSSIALNPGKVMSYADIVDKINEKIGTKVRIEFVENTKTDEFYLKEIRVCYDLNFQRINCPGTKLLSAGLRDLQIRHLNYVPAV